MLQKQHIVIFCLLPPAVPKFPTALNPIPNGVEGEDSDPPSNFFSFKTTTKLVCFHKI